MSELLHASCVSLCGRGILLLGASASGKSDLALRLIQNGAMLVADDQVKLESQNQQLLARPPAKLEGLLEVRGVGIMRMPYLRETGLALAVRLVPPDEVDRLPEAYFEEHAGIRIPGIALHAFESAATEKICSALCALS